MEREDATDPSGDGTPVVPRVPRLREHAPNGVCLTACHGSTTYVVHETLESRHGTRGRWVPEGQHRGPEPRARRAEGGTDPLVRGQRGHARGRPRRPGRVWRGSSRGTSGPPGRPR